MESLLISHSFIYNMSQFYCAFAVRLLEFWLDESVCVALSLVYNIDLIRLCVSENIEVMANKIHLDTCVLWIHRLYSELPHQQMPC